MKDLTFGTLLAVFEEIFGSGLFWAMVLAAGLVTVAYLFVLVRDRSMSMRRFLLAQISMPFGAVAAVLFVQSITNSHLRDIGGPIDVIVLLMVAAMGAMGAAILTYVSVRGRDIVSSRASLRPEPARSWSPHRRSVHRSRPRWFRRWSLPYRGSPPVPSRRGQARVRS